MGCVLSCTSSGDVATNAPVRSNKTPEVTLSSYLLEPSTASRSLGLWMQTFERLQCPIPSSLIQGAPLVVQEAAQKERQRCAAQLQQQQQEPAGGGRVSRADSTDPTSSPAKHGPPSSSLPLQETVYFRYAFGQWNGGLHGLDEVFQQCRQVTMARRGGDLSTSKGGATSSSNTTTNAAAAAHIHQHHTTVVPSMHTLLAEESGRPSRCDSVGDDDSDPDEEDDDCSAECEKSIPELTDYFSGHALAHLMHCLHLSNDAHVLYLIYVLSLDDRRRVDLAGTSPSRMREIFDIQEWTVTRATWMEGWLRHGCTSVSQARIFCQQLATNFDALLMEEQQFRSFHKFLFRFLPKDTATRGAVARDRSISIWKFVFANRWPLLDYFVQYVQQQRPVHSVITADQWDSLPEFACAMRYELNLLQYDSSASSWPSLMDDFVSYTVHSLQQHDVESRCSTS